MAIAVQQSVVRKRRSVMEVKVERLGKVSFTVQARQHLVLSDQPRSDGGSDTGMTPPELFLASLGTCVGYYVAHYFDTRMLKCAGFEVHVQGEILSNPGRIGNIAIEIHVPVDLKPERLEVLLRTVTHCTIYNTLTTHPPEIDVRIQTPVTVAAS
jgi:putative redox protein